MSKDDLALLEFLKNGKNQPNESLIQMNSKNISVKDTDSDQCYQKKKSLVEDATYGKFYR